MSTTKSDKAISGKFAALVSDLRVIPEWVATFLVHEDRAAQLRLWDFFLAFMRKVSELHLSEDDERRMMQYQAIKMLESLDEE